MLVYLVLRLQLTCASLIYSELISSITSFQKLGVKYIALKPGSTEAFGQVVAIARAHPTFSIICQWTGGRAGGHHSFEDFHSPILSMYSTVRRCSNIILIAGSGFGGADDTEPYLTGEWALKFAHPPMPFDGVLFGSRVMTALEARTSIAVCYLFAYLLSIGKASDCRCSRSGR